MTEELGDTVEGNLSHLNFPIDVERWIVIVVSIKKMIDSHK